MHTQHPTCSGFTLIEVLLSIALLTILATTTGMMYNAYKWDSDIGMTTSAFTQMMRRAQVLSKIGGNSSPWGVHVDEANITLFHGDDFATRDQNFDEVYTFPNTIEISKNPAISGTCENDAKITVTITSTAEELQTLCRNGTFIAYPLKPFLGTGNAASAIQTDKAGNISSVSSITW